MLRPALVAGAVSILACGCSSSSPEERRPEPAVREVPLRGHHLRSDGRTLDVVFEAGACDRVTSATGARAARAVRVSVRVVEDRRGADACIAILRAGVATVRLDRPLGRRRVVDASNGCPVPRASERAVAEVREGRPGTAGDGLPAPTDCMARAPRSGPGGRS